MGNLKQINIGEPSTRPVFPYPVKDQGMKPKNIVKPIKTTGGAR